MNLLSYLSRRGTAPVARERTAFGRSDLVAILREEILAVIAKHVAIDQEKVKVTMERGEAVSTLGVDIELPDNKVARLASA